MYQYTLLTGSVLADILMANVINPKDVIMDSKHSRDGEGQVS